MEHKENEILAESFKTLLKEADEPVRETIKTIVSRHQLQILHSMDGGNMTREIIAAYAEAVEFLVAHKEAGLELTEIRRTIFDHMRLAFSHGFFEDPELFKAYCGILRSLIRHFEEAAMVQFSDILSILLTAIRGTGPIAVVSLEVWSTVVSNCAGNKVADLYMPRLNIFGDLQRNGASTETFAKFLGLWEVIISTSPLNALCRRGVINGSAVLILYPELRNRAITMLERMFEVSRNHVQEPATAAEWNELVVPLIGNAQ